ncbi:MAG: hypothetical protein ABSF26_12170 [Thermoguttaceae bacterium]|jgi:hypothetical protein
MRLPALIAVISIVCVSAIGLAADVKPAILFCSPQGLEGGWADLTYLNELHAKGFEVDYTVTLDELTPERIRKYNVLVIYVTPDAFDVTNRGQKSSPQKIERFVAMIDAYAAAGGGVLLMPTEANILKQQVSDLAEPWGARLPVELIEESDKEKLAALSHASQQVPLAWTDQVLPSPVSSGINGVWYPIAPAYNAQMSGSIVADNQWRPVVKGSKTTVTKPIDLAKSTMPVLERPFLRAPSMQPVIFAIREYRRGRIALLNQWRQFSIGSGTRYIFNREVLSAGLSGRPSDLGKLLENTYRWLAEPSLSSAGYVTDPRKLLAPNDDPAIKKAYADRFWPYQAAELSSAAAPANTRICRGLIGAKTTYSSGVAGVAEYARAAAAAGLDFLVFLDDFEKLDASKLRQLKTDCDRHSTPRLRLLPGFSIRNNVGNRMFFYSPDPVWIPDYCLTGKDKKTLYIQEEDGHGGYTGYLTPFLDWVLGAYHVEKGQVGYFDFSASPHGMRLHDLRLYGMAAVRYYRGGRLVEDNTADYLTTVQATIPPAPASVDEVYSPAELAREVAAGHSLVYVQARSLESLFMDGLRWTHQYDSPMVYMSDGPTILAWCGCYRVATLGAEEFVTGMSVMPSPLGVLSEKGLKEIRIYNGSELYRRFSWPPHAAPKAFRQTLVLDGNIQKNLVVVAEDVAGHRAITFARRCWKDGGLAVAFCSDHVNDGTMALAHGPYSYPWIRQPSLPMDIAGWTWDGGPLAALPLASQETVPVLDSDKGKEDGGRFDQIPLLDFSDDGALAVSSVRNELFDDKVKLIVNPWHTYGPIAGPSRLFSYTQRYREWAAPTVAVPRTGWAAPGVRRGTNASIFRNEIVFRQGLRIRSLSLGHFYAKPLARLFVHCGGRERLFDLGRPGNDESFLLRPGDWFGLFATGLANSNLFFNRGDPLWMDKRGTTLLFRADGDGRAVQQGDRCLMEFAAVGFPLDVEIHTAADLQQYVSYLEKPEGMEVLRGRRVAGPGVVQLAPDARLAVEIVVPRPPRKLCLTLPCLVDGLNPRWSAGLFQKQGYVKGDYGSGENRYRAIGLDSEGKAYVPLYVDRADGTHVVIGHPIIAGPEAAELFVQVTKVGEKPDRWHVSVNNPTDKPIATTLRQSILLPGLVFPDCKITVAPGQCAVLQ